MTKEEILTSAIPMVAESFFKWLEDHYMRPRKEYTITTVLGPAYGEGSFDGKYKIVGKIKFNIEKVKDFTN